MLDIEREKERQREMGDVSALVDVDIAGRSILRAHLVPQKKSTERQKFKNISTKVLRTVDEYRYFER